MRSSFVSRILSLLTVLALTACAAACGSRGEPTGAPISVPPNVGENFWWASIQVQPPPSTSTTVVPPTTTTSPDPESPPSTAPPLPPTTAPPETIQVPGDVLFDPDSAELAASASQAVAQLTDLLAASGRPFRLYCYTDSRGDTAYNLKLAQRRADALSAALQAAGFTPLSAEGRGEDEPVGDNSTDTGRALNRRCTTSLESP